MASEHVKVDARCLRTRNCGCSPLVACNSGLSLAAARNSGCSLMATRKSGCSPLAAQNSGRAAAARRHHVPPIRPFGAPTPFIRSNYASEAFQTRSLDEPMRETRNLDEQTRSEREKRTPMLSCVKRPRWACEPHIRPYKKGERHVAPRPRCAPESPRYSFSSPEMRRWYMASFAASSASSSRGASSLEPYLRSSAWPIR